ncbi:MAG: SHOCT domain-containing protein [Candidatus Edwardsbacteria bacterium]|jgi:hypothetical protein|nr:SHOCT domain-containing protein [Candidatus Edwardsbacteria bacterium]
MSVIASLKQKARYSGTQEFALLDDGMLDVYTKDGGKTHQFKIDLAALDPNYTRVRNIAYQWYIGIFGWLFFSVVFIAWGLSMGEAYVAKYILVVIGVLIGAMSFVSYMQATIRSRDVILFKVRNDPKSYLVLWNYLPDPESFSRFLEMLVKKISSVSIVPPGKTAGTFAAELVEIGRMREKGLLTDEEFILAKKRLLEPQDQGGIGFKINT